MLSFHSRFSIYSLSSSSLSLDKLQFISIHLLALPGLRIRIPEWNEQSCRKSQGNERSRISTRDFRLESGKLLLRISNPSKLNTKIRKEKVLALHFVAFVFFDACICLFVNSPSLLLVSEAGHQKGRENKSGPARQGLSYITTPRCALLNFNLTVVLQYFNRNYITNSTKKPFLYHNPPLHSWL